MHILESIFEIRTVVIRDFLGQITEKMEKIWLDGDQVKCYQTIRFFIDYFIV